MTKTAAVSEYTTEEIASATAIYEGRREAMEALPGENLWTLENLLAWARSDAAYAAAHE